MVKHEHKDDDDNVLLEEVVTYTCNEKDHVSTVKHMIGNTEGLSNGASTENDTLKRVVIN